MVGLRGTTGDETIDIINRMKESMNTQYSVLATHCGIEFTGIVKNTLGSYPLEYEFVTHYDENGIKHTTHAKILEVF